MTSTIRGSSPNHGGPVAGSMPTICHPSPSSAASRTSPVSVRTTPTLPLRFSSVVVAVAWMLSAAAGGTDSRCSANPFGIRGAGFCGSSNHEYRSVSATPSPSGRSPVTVAVAGPSTTTIVDDAGVVEAGSASAAPVQAEATTDTASTNAGSVRAGEVGGSETSADDAIAGVLLEGSGGMDEARALTCRSCAL